MIQPPPAPFEEVQHLANLLTGQQVPDSILPDDWERILALAAYHRVVPLLYHSLEPYLDDAQTVFDRLRLMGLHCKARSLAISETVKSVNAVLNGADIPTLWLKGVALAYTVYDHPWLRYMKDVDVLVPAPHALVALDMLREAGLTYIAYRDEASGVEVSAKDSLKIYHHFVLQNNNGIIVELHFDVGIREFTRSPAEKLLNWFWDASHIVETPIGSLRILKPANEFLHGATHDLLQHQNNSQIDSFDNHFRLYRKLDQYLLLKRYDLDWEDVIRQGARFDWLYPVWKSIEQTHSLFDVPADFDLLKQRFMRHEEAQYDPAFDLNKEPLYIRFRRLWRTFNGLSGPAKVTFLWRTILFPAEADMRAIYGTHPDKRLWRLHALRLRKISLKGLRLLRYWLRITYQSRFRLRKTNHGEAPRPGSRFD